MPGSTPRSDTPTGPDPAALAQPDRAEQQAEVGPVLRAALARLAADAPAPVVVAAFDSSI